MDSSRHGAKPYGARSAILSRATDVRDDVFVNALILLA
jgi:hypothetical protein